MNLSTQATITWCPGCPNNAILVAFRKAVTELCDEGKAKFENIVAGAGVGCHAKILDYLNMNTFNGLHGRSLPTMTGMKIANPDLQIVTFSGDGDSFSEGLNHLMHAAQRNTDINVFIHNNQIYALTTGQATATSPRGFKGPSRPSGSIEDPMNPLLFMLGAGATFVARTYAGEIEKTKQIMKAAILHKGFTYVEIIQPCITFYDTRDFFKERITWLPDDHNSSDLDQAIKEVRAGGEKVPLGIFYQTDRPTFEEQL